MTLPNPLFLPALKPTSLALLSILVMPAVQAADIFNGLDLLPGGTGSNAYAVNADGTVVVGSGSSASGTQAFRWTSSGIVGLDLLPGTTSSYAQAVNADGTAVVGYVNSATGQQAFRWTSSGMLGLGYLGGGRRISNANAVNDDGTVVVGYSSSASGTQAFRWTSSGMVGLGFLPGDISSSALAVNADGTVVVGVSNGVGGASSQAFRWTSSGMVGLGVFPGGRYSRALAVNADGTVVVGVSNGAAGTYSQAFRWTSSGMDGLGFLPGGTGSYAQALNADGTVVVGYGLSAAGDQAFRWTQAGGMHSVAQWLSNAGVGTTGFTALSRATGVSANGNTVVGYGITTNGASQAFIARVDSVSKGIVGFTDLANSITQTLSPSNQMEGLSQLTMNGAHHRTLMDMAIGDTNSCTWVNGDAGRVYRSANGYTGLAEAGVCHDFAEQGLRVGAGVGSSFNDLKLANNGNSRLQGQYGLAEIDWQVPNKPLLASLLGIYGQWDANLRRGYAISGTTPSTGDTNVTAYILRARLDWQNAFYLGQVAMSPRIAYTATRSEIDGYQEQGGSAPASFNDQNHTAQELRAGLTGLYVLNDKINLLGHTEIVHRFDERGANVSGNVNVLGGAAINNFNLSGNAISRDWVRVGAEIDYKLSKRSLWNASSFVSTAGQDADITTAMSYRLAF